MATFVFTREVENRGNASRVLFGGPRNQGNRWDLQVSTGLRSYKWKVLPEQANRLLVNKIVQTKSSTIRHQINSERNAYRER